MAKSWTAGGNLNTGRDETWAAGTPSAGLVSAGGDSGGVGMSSAEKYNGTSWSTASGTIAQSRVNVSGGNGVGSQSAALICGGHPTDSGASPLNSSEHYNGTAWSAGGTLNASGQENCGGTQTSAIVDGGYNSGDIGNAETYNGTTWSNITSETASRDGASCGASNSAFLHLGGTNLSNATRFWNGSVWASGGSNNVTTGGSALGTATLAITYGNANAGQTDIYNGSTWSNTSTARPVDTTHISGTGTEASGLTIGGSLALTSSYVWSDVTSQILKVSGVAQASISKISSVALANIKKVSGVANS